MRTIHFLIAAYFVILTCAAQTEPLLPVYKSTIENIENPIVLYRGWSNKLRISYPGADSIAVSGVVVKSVDSTGVYNVSPGPGTENDIVINAWMPDGTTRHETRRAIVKNTQQPDILLNGSRGSVALQKSQARQAKVGLAATEGPETVSFEVTGFEVAVWRKSKKRRTRSIQVEGDTFNEAALHLINSLHAGDVFFIYRVRSKCSVPALCILPAPMMVTISPETE